MQPATGSRPRGRWIAGDSTRRKQDRNDGTHDPSSMVARSSGNEGARGRRGRHDSSDEAEKQRRVGVRVQRALGSSAGSWSAMAPRAGVELSLLKPSCTCAAPAAIRAT